MQIIKYPSPATWDALLKRPSGSLEETGTIVAPILEAVKNKGDAALLAYAAQFEKVTLQTLLVSEEEIKTASKLVDSTLQAAILQAKNNIELFHRQQQQATVKTDTMPGVTCWRKDIAIEKVGIYIPGGSAPLFSTVLMLAIPAGIAGCREIILCSPPGENGHIHPAIIYTAHLCGINLIIKAGGAQAIAAMAYGTATVPKVDKIFGPGNQFVTAAKQLVQQYGTAIDMPAGPSEVLVIADHTASPEFVALDLLSQAEHGPDSQVILVTDHAPLAAAVQQEINVHLQQLPRKSIAEKALENSSIIILQNLEEAMSLSNAYAPEHLILAVAEPLLLAEQVINAGSVFLGHYSPEAAGDYASGTNHTLPTNGYARAYSGVSVDSFVKKVTFQQLSAAGLQLLGPTIETMAAAEQLEAHRKAIMVRLNTLS